MTLRSFPPERIICLTEETVETLYLLGEEDRIVGVTGYAVRPQRVRREKPRIGAYTSVRLDKILALEPDLVLSFSDLQADIVAELLRAGVTVMSYNQRDIAGIIAMIRHLAHTIGEADKGEKLAIELEQRLNNLKKTKKNKYRPLVYFEEWDEPMISGIGWVSELVDIAGGRDVFSDLGHRPSAQDRIVTPEQVIKAAPDVIIASWCGKKVQPEKIYTRPGWEVIPAIRDKQIYEIKSPLILQPGPAALTDGLDKIIEALS